MSENNLIPHLFRTEFTKIIAVLCKTYGISNIQLAEDIVSDTFLKAAETWGLKGIPEHPKAWLYQVAKNNAKDQFKREKIFRDKIQPNLKCENRSETAPEIDLSDGNIKDSQLRMLFSVCDPALSNEGQIVLALRVLCGFGIDEIAHALLSTKSTINKRLFRAKEKFRNENNTLSFPTEDEVPERLSAVLAVLYLLYNEGYHSTVVEKAIRKDLCFESMRLLFLTLNNTTTNLPEANALMALFCFHASRFDARTNDEGEVILYTDQDQSKWNPELIEKGEYYLMLASRGELLTKYHLEASIAYWHTRKHFDKVEKWDHILQYYNRLLQIQYSPITALNRTYALAMARGNDVALKEMLKIDINTLGAKNHYLYHSLLAELYKENSIEKTAIHLKKALELSPNEHSRSLLKKKLAALS